MARTGGIRGGTPPADTSETANLQPLAGPETGTRAYS